MGWSRLVVAFKEQRPGSTAAEFLRKIASAVQEGSRHWDTDMRYRATEIKKSQAEGVLLSTHWLADHYADIIKKQGGHS